MYEPRDEDAVASVIRDAANASKSLSIQGGASRRGLGHDVAGAPVSLTGLSGITLYEPGALTLVVRAGTPLKEIKAALAEEGQMLPFEPPCWAAILGNGAHAESTIGGVVATNASGPRRIHSGACRDSLIGVRFVDGAGRILKNGGRVMKNVTGYDLVKLMCGTHGTLGVLTEVSFKLLPKPESQATVSLTGLDNQQAVAAMSAALGSPYNVSGAAHVPSASDGQSRTCLRLEGLAQSVSYRAAELMRQLDPFGSPQLDTDVDAVSREWQSMGAADALATESGRDIWRISVKPTDGPRVAAALEGATVFFDWGGGLVWAAVDAGTDVRSRLAGIDGHATLFKADTDNRQRLGVFHPEDPAIARYSQRLKQEFDPSNILNRGRMG